MQKSADAIVRYWKEVELQGKSWDGIYTDDFFYTCVVAYLQEEDMVLYAPC